MSGLPDSSRPSALVNLVALFQKKTFFCYSNCNMDMTKEKLELGCHYGVDGVLYLFAAGKISNEHLEEYSTWADEVKKIIEERAAAGDNPIRVLSDISLVTHFERKPIAVLRELLAHDSRFPVRSAIVGGNRFAVLMLDSIISILRRENVRHFKDKETALRWLLVK